MSTNNLRILTDADRRYREAVELIRFGVRTLEDREHSDLLPDLQLWLYDAKRFLRGER